MKSKLAAFLAGAVTATAIGVAAQSVDRSKLATARDTAATVAAKFRNTPGNVNNADRDALLLNLSIVVLGEKAP